MTTPTSLKITSTALPKTAPAVFPKLMKLKCTCGTKCDPTSCDIVKQWIASQPKMSRASSGPSLNAILEVDEEKHNNSKKKAINNMDKATILAKRHSAPSLIDMSNQQRESRGEELEPIHENEEGFQQTKKV